MAGKISYAAIASKNIKNQESSKPNTEETKTTTTKIAKDAPSPVDEFPALKGALNESVVVNEELKSETEEKKVEKQVEEKKPEAAAAPVVVKEQEAPEDDSNSAFIEIKKRSPRSKNNSESRPASYRANGGFKSNGPRRTNNSNNSAPRNNADSSSTNGQPPKRQNDTRTFDERSEEEKAKYLNRFKEPKNKLCFDLIRGDLFNVGEHVSLAHCVSEDFAMSKGIATEFKKRFNGVDELLAQNVKVGGCAYLKHNDRYIFYLVTKKFFAFKPYYNSVEKSLKAMRDLCKEFGVRELAMPMIGSGLDRLDWALVSRIIDDVFGKNTGVQITVIRFDSKADNKESNASRY